jgi:hypothetical protein
MAEGNTEKTKKKPNPTRDQFVGEGSIEGVSPILIWAHLYWLQEGLYTPPAI